MSHSKQTANYGLPLFEPKDRPAWLTDFNGAMTAVDATVKGLADSIQAGGLPVTGGTMQGSINMGDHAITNVQEVELQSSGDGLYIGSVVQPNGTAGARLTGVAGGAAAFVKPDSQSIYVPVSVGSPTADKHAATKEYVDTAIAGIPSSGITQEQADERYLQLSGGTMAGDLKVQESPASATSAVSKSYAQGLFASALPKSGGTMTGDLILSGAPTADNQAATKAYVDGKLGDGNLVADIPSTTYGTYGNIEIPIPNTVDLTRDFILEITTNGYITSGSITDNAYLGMCGTYDKGTSRAEMVFLVGNQGSSQQTLNAATIKARFTACGYHCSSGSIDEHLFVSAGRIFAINSSKNLIIGFKHASGYGINIAIKIYQ